MTMYDVSRGQELIRQHEEAAHQLSLADLVILSMTDPVKKVDPADFIRSHNPNARVVRNNFDVMATELDTGTYPEKTGSPASHSSGYASLVLQTSAPQPAGAIVEFLHHLASICGPSLLRLKGFTRITEDDSGPLLVQMSGQIVHDPVKLDRWPEEIRCTQLVVIGKNLDMSMVNIAFNSFFGIAEIDTPDRDAITQNPLAIPGF